MMRMASVKKNPERAEASSRQPSPGAGKSCGSCRYYLQFPDDDDDDDDDDGYILEGEEDPEDRETGPEEKWS